MADRLKDIWDGFAQRTQTRLTTTELSPLSRPSGTDRAEQELDLTLSGKHLDPVGGEAVRAALDALHQSIQTKAKRSARPRRGQQQSYSAPEPESYEVKGGLDDQLLSDLKFTEARIRRSGSSYLGFARERQDAWTKKRKKLFGIF